MAARKPTTRPRSSVSLFLLVVLVLLLSGPRDAAADPLTGSADSALLESNGGFARVWNQQFFLGPGVLSLEELGGPVEPFRLLADFEPHEAVLLAGGKLAEKAPSVLAAVLANLKGNLQPVLLLSSREEEVLLLKTLREHEVSMDGIRVMNAPTDTVWVRDFGPVFVRGPRGSLRAIDPAYGKGRDKDDSVPQAVSKEFGIPLIETELIWQGGNLLSNGEGLLVTTTQSINANVESGRDAKTALSFLKERLGIREVAVLEHLEGETTGHVDMFACFASPGTILVGRYAESADPVNADILERNAARLAGIRVGPRMLEVIRIPMPRSDDGVWRTYTNVLFAGGALLVPLYPDVDPDADREALAVFRAALPDRKIIGIDATSLIDKEGGLRCICGYVPRRHRATRTLPDRHRIERNETPRGR